MSLLIPSNFVSSTNRHRASRCSALTAALLLMLASMASVLLSRPGLAQDVVELRRPVLGYFAAVEARDVEGALGQWSGRSPYLAAQRENLAGLLKAFDEIRFRNVDWVQLRQRDQEATVHVSFDLETREVGTGKQDAPQKAQRRTFLLVSESGTWRIWRYVVSERLLAEAILRAPDEAGRERALRDESDLVTPALIEQLRAVISGADAGLPLPERLARFAVALQLAERVGDTGELGQVLLDRGTLLYERDRYPEAAADLERAVPLLQAAGSADTLTMARFNLGLVYVYQNRFRDALPPFEAAAEHSEAAGATRRLAQTRYWIGFARHSLQDFAGALTAYQSSALLSAEVKDQRGEARALRKLGDVHRAQIHDDDALLAWQRSADLYRDAGMPRDEAEVLYDIGLLNGVHGRFPAAYIAQFRRLKVATELKDRPIQASCLSDLAGTLIALGKSAEASEFLALELTLRRRLMDAAGEGHALGELGRVYQDLSRFGDAETTLQQALEIARRLPERDHEARTQALLARLYGDRSDYLRASEAGEQAVRLYRELKLKNREADAVRELGRQYRAQGRHQDALAQFAISLELDRAGGDPLGEARDLDEMALDHLQSGRFQDALSIYGQVLAVYQSAKLRVGEADAHNKLGAAFQRLGRYTEAEAAYRQSLAISEELDAEAGRQQARANLAGLYTTTGRYEEAIKGYEEALEGFRKLRSRSSEGTVLGNLGKVYSGKGDLERALQYHQSAVKVYTELKDSAGVAREVHSIAGIEMDRARYAEALTGFAEALRVFRSVGLRLEEANTLSAQANAYQVLGKPAEALALFEESRKVRAAIGDGPGLARLGASVGSVHLHAGRYAEARQAYQDALKAVRALGEKPSEPGLLNNLALTLRALGRIAEARTALEEALTASRALGDPAGEAAALGNLAFVEFAAGRRTESERAYREALRLAGPGRYPQVAFRCWIGLALLHREQKQWRFAARDLARATGLIDRIRGDVREQSLQSSFLEQYVSPFHLQADSLLAAGEPAAAFLAGERARARGLVDVLRGGKVAVTRSLSPAERDAEARLDGRLTALTAELRESRFLPTDQLLAREAQVTETRGALEQLRRELYLAHPQLKAQRGAFNPPTLTQLNRGLFQREPGLCLLSYVVGRSETLLFAVTRGTTPTGPASLQVYRVSVTRAALEAQVQEFWGACSQPGGDFRASGAGLYRSLIAPAASSLRGRSHVVVLPDGPLHLLPFHALPDSRGKHLVELAPVSYAPSVSALVAMTELGDRRRQENPGPDALPLLALGRPKLDAGLGDLPATEQEVRAIASIVGAGSKPHIGADASEERLKSDAPRARFVHLATHGLVDEAAPLYSAVALAHGKGEDGRLEAREVMELDLRAHLVVLSACETALGKTVGGEGVLGLTWSLFVAGAPSTVVSHWQVEDETTGTLMGRFYRAMLTARVPTQTGPRPSGPLGKSQALRAAQLALLRDHKHAHPYYWAPFILVGDWR